MPVLKSSQATDFAFGFFSGPFKSVYYFRLNREPGAATESSTSNRKPINLNSILPQGLMKQAEPKNAVVESTRSILVNAANDKCNMRFVYSALLSMALDLLVFQALFALGANLELAQITSFLAGAILSFALNADRGASGLKHSSIRSDEILVGGSSGTAYAQCCSYAGSWELALATASGDLRGNPGGHRCFSGRRCFFHLSSIRCE